MDGGKGLFWWVMRQKSKHLRLHNITDFTVNALSLLQPSFALLRGALTRAAEGTAVPTPKFIKILQIPVWTHYLHGQESENLAVLGKCPCSAAGSPLRPAGTSHMQAGLS